MMPSTQAKPFELTQIIRRKSCGKDLRQRVSEICQSRGGFSSYTLARRHRMRRGIVHECCENECSNKDLTRYCSNIVHESESNESSRTSDSNEQSSLPPSIVMERHRTSTVQVLHAVDKGNSIESNENGDKRITFTSTQTPATVTATPPSITTTTTTESIPFDLGDITIDPPNARIDSQTWYKIYLIWKKTKQQSFEVGTVPPEYKSQPFSPAQYKFSNV